jgi:cytochrome P450
MEFLIISFRFDPELEKTRPKLAYIPFGVGSRYCIGKHLALMEIKMAVVRLLSSFR